MKIKNINDVYALIHLPYCQSVAELERFIQDATGKTDVALGAFAKLCQQRVRRLRALQKILQNQRGVSLMMGQNALVLRVPRNLIASLRKKKLVKEHCLVPKRFTTAEFRSVMERLPGEIRQALVDYYSTDDFFSEGWGECLDDNPHPVNLKKIAQEGHVTCDEWCGRFLENHGADKKTGKGGTVTERALQLPETVNEEELIAAMKAGAGKVNAGLAYAAKVGEDASRYWRKLKRSIGNRAADVCFWTCEIMISLYAPQDLIDLLVRQGLVRSDDDGGQDAAMASEEEIEGSCPHKEVE